MQPDSNLSAPANNSAPAPPPRSQRSKEDWRSIFSTILILIVAPLIALFLTAFVFQSYEVDGPSMETTLQHKDRLIVWKVPRTVARVTNNYFIPGRGEIIVFVKRGISDYSSQGDKQLIKRVVATPGERVVVRDGEVTVYNPDHPEGFNPDVSGGYSTEPRPTLGTVDMVVQEGEVFVLGDNRANSLDSRSFGTVSAEDIVGVLAFRVFPFNKAKSF
jgi:signal peptidase I